MVVEGQKGTHGCCIPVSASLAGPVSVDPLLE